MVLKDSCKKISFSGTFGSPKKYKNTRNDYNNIFIVLDALKSLPCFHFVQVNTDIFTFSYASFGVLQGSILGPGLFNLCLMLCLNVNTCNMQMIPQSILIAKQIISK